MAEPKLCEPNPQWGVLPAATGWGNILESRTRFSPSCLNRSATKEQPSHTIPQPRSRPSRGNHPLFGPYWCCAWQ